MIAGVAGLGAAAVALAPFAETLAPVVLPVAGQVASRVADEAKQAVGGVINFAGNATN
ncbi:hypothetical protein PFLU3_27030 [Pseudomonas fluorescens]|uniref:Uncharacterized protein n=1 Tax=Pseudomonas fluorescens TaxID=294 RepID=A0A0D0TI77_PSEFL|nr:hypothetical protein C4K02_4632 [Pseudomonas synxantha]KIR21814.1 hypothetical protein PFLU3_27030 [Pseudomonas fluorescens]